MTNILYPFKKLYAVIERSKVSKFLKNITIEKVDSLNGYDFELLVAEILKNCGFKCEQTPKSNDNGADIIAVKNNIKLAVQTKLYFNHSVGNKAVQEVFTAKNYFKAQVGVLVTNSSLTKSAIETAKKCNISLIDRKLLQVIIKNSRKENAEFFEQLIYENIKGNINEN